MLALAITLQLVACIACCSALDMRKAVAKSIEWCMHAGTRSTISVQSVARAWTWPLMVMAASMLASTLCPADMAFEAELCSWCV